jgi:hypothetical protein
MSEAIAAKGIRAGRAAGGFPCIFGMIERGELHLMLSWMPKVYDANPAGRLSSTIASHTRGADRTAWTTSSFAAEPTTNTRPTWSTGRFLWRSDALHDECHVSENRPQGPRFSGCFIRPREVRGCDLGPRTPFRGAPADRTRGGRKDGVVRTETHSSDGAQASDKPYSRQAPGRCVACTPHPSILANEGAKRQQLAGLERSGTDRCALSRIGSSPASHSRPRRRTNHPVSACK